MAPNPYVKAVTGSSGPKLKKDKKPAAAAAATKPKPAKKEPTATSADDDVLRAEILALGGDEEDMNMLMGVESESEFEEDAEPPKSTETTDGKKMGSDKVDVSCYDTLARGAR